MSILDTELVLTVGEGRRLLRLGKGAMYKAIHSGKIKSIKINGKILIPSAEMRRILEATSALYQDGSVPETRPNLKEKNCRTQR